MKTRESIWIYAACYNEEDMMPFFLNHYLHQVDKIIIYDNQSTDASRNIASKFPAVEIRELDTSGQFSEDKLTDFRNNCWLDAKADYIIVCDIDEFLFYANGSLLDFIRKRPSFDVWIPAGFDMVARSLPADKSKPITEQIQHGAFSKSMSKPIMFKKGRVRRINFSPGSHSAFPETIDGKTPVIYRSYLFNYDLRLLHFKYLGVERLLQRHRNDRALRMNLSISPDEAIKREIHGFHYLYDRNSLEEKFVELENHSIDCTQRKLPMAFKIKTSLVNNYNYSELRERFFVPFREWTRPLRRSLVSALKKCAKWLS